MYLGLGCRGLGLLLSVCAGVWMAADLVVWVLVGVLPEFCCSL